VRKRSRSVDNKKKSVTSRRNGKGLRARKKKGQFPPLLEAKKKRERTRGTIERKEE